MNRWGIVLVVVLFVLSGMFWVYQYWGGKYIIRVNRQISVLDEQGKSNARTKLYGEPQENQYSGILMKIVKGKYVGVWVWGGKGPRYFRGDEFGVYTFFDGCTQEILHPEFTGQPVSVGHNVTDGVLWSESARVGDFVKILITEEGKGGTVGNLREIYTYNWWSFLPGSMEQLCVN
jgi:hypothetical protein